MRASNGDFGSFWAILTGLKVSRSPLVLLLMSIYNLLYPT